MAEPSSGRFITLSSPISAIGVTGVISSANQGNTRVSRPGRRIYLASDTIPKVRNGLGIGVVSTSKGIMTDRAAREASVGGEYLCEVW